MQDETFPSLESLARLFPKVLQNIILFFGMFLAGKCTYIPTNNATKSKFQIKSPKFHQKSNIFSKDFKFWLIFLKFLKKIPQKVDFSLHLHWNFHISQVSKVSWDFIKKSRSLVRLLKCETLSTLLLIYWAYDSIKNKSTF